MSYDVDLLDNLSSRKVLKMPEKFEDGGTYAIGGTNDCSLNITFNYIEVFGSLVDDLHLKFAKDTLPALRAFCDQYKRAEPWKDYWAPTPGNARAAIMRLISFAEQHPTGVWMVGK